MKVYAHATKLVRLERKKTKKTKTKITITTITILLLIRISEMSNSVQHSALSAGKNKIFIVSMSNKTRKSERCVSRLKERSVTSTRFCLHNSNFKTKK